MWLRETIAAAWLRAKQRQALGGTPNGDNPRLAVLRLFAGQLAAASGDWCLRRSAHGIGLALVLLVAAQASGLAVLPNPAAGLGQAVDEQADAEDAVLCRKFGFVTGSPAHVRCKLALADLRRRDEASRAAAYDWP